MPLKGVFARLQTGVLVRLEAFRQAEEGQGLVEYSLILVLISLVSLLVLAQLGTKISGVFQLMTDTL